jgi:hypothetical protein
MARFDIHRPAVIEPADYEFVCNEAIKITGIEDCHFIMAERARKAAHFARTGGKYATHEHGGNCHVCGAAAIYTCLFWHAPTNTYIRTGNECAEKLGYGDAADFRKKVGHALEAVAGKRKAKAVLEAAGAGKAWEIKEAVEARFAANNAAYAAWKAANPEPEYAANGPYGVEEIGAPKPAPTTNDELTVLDIVRRLIKYGNITDKAMNYLKVLAERIEKAPAIAAARAAEAEAAKPVPVVKGRTVIRGEVLTVKTVEGFYGCTVKMLVKHADGWKAWGTMPAGLFAEKGDLVEFAATLEAAADDPKFGFWKRPAKAMVVEKAAAPAAAA